MFTIQLLALDVSSWDAGSIFGRLLGLALVVTIPLLAVLALVRAVRRPGVLSFLLAGVSGIMAVVLLGMFAWAFVDGFRKGMAEAEASSKMKVMTGKGGGFEIMVPEDWQDGPAGMAGGEAELKVGNPRLDEYMMVSSGEKRRGVNFESFKTAAFGLTAAEMQKVSTSPERSFQIGSLRSSAKEFTGVRPEVSPEPMTCRLTCVEGAETYYVLIQWSPAATAKRSKERFEKVVASFRESSSGQSAAHVPTRPPMRGSGRIEPTSGSKDALPPGVTRQ